MSDIIIAEITIPDSPDVKVYTATQTYISASSGTPANTIFKGRISNNLSLSKELGFFVWNTQSKSSVGTIDLINDEFYNYDDLIDYTNIRDSLVKISIVDENAALSTATQIGEYIIDNVSNPNDKITRISLLDKTALLERNTTHDYFENTIQHVKNRDQPEPIPIGYVYQVDIPVINKTNGIYHIYSEYSAGDETIFIANNELKERADPFIYTADYVAIQDATTGALAIDLVNATNNGTITCDFLSYRYDTTKATNTFEGFIGRLLVDSGNYLAVDIDFTTAADIDTAHGYGYGYYIKSGSNIKSILSAACASHCGFYYIKNDGDLAFDYLQAPAATAVREIEEINLTSGVKVSIDLAQGLSDSVAARKNVYVFSYDDVAKIGSLSEEGKQIASSEFQFYVKSTDTIAGIDVFDDTYAHARNGCYIPTLLTEESNAEDLITQLEDLYAVKRKFYEFDFEADSTLDILNLELNETINLTHTRYGLELGKKLRVVKIQIKDILKNKATIVAWG